EDQLALQFGLSSGQLSDIWIYGLPKNTKTKLTFDQHSYSPVCRWLKPRVRRNRCLRFAWTADGRDLLYIRAHGNPCVVSEQRAQIDTTAQLACDMGGGRTIL